MLLSYRELSECRETAAAAANSHELSRGVHPVRGVSESVRPFRLVARLQRHIAADPGCPSAQDAYSKAH